MILVDSSVWIDYFRGIATPQTDRLDGLLSDEPVAIGDVILTEVLQGFTRERDFDEAQQLLTWLTVVEVVGRDIAIEAARNVRSLRRLTEVGRGSPDERRNLRHSPPLWPAAGRP